MTTPRACQILGVEPGASPKAIQRAYRKAALKTHPDRAKSPAEAEEFARLFIEVRDAYEHLRKGGFPGPSSEDIMADAGLADVTLGMTPAGRSFYRKDKKEDEEMTLSQKLGFEVRIDLEAIFLWGFLIPGGAIVVALFARYLFKTLSGP